MPTQSADFIADCIDGALQAKLAKSPPEKRVHGDRMAFSMISGVCIKGKVCKPAPCDVTLGDIRTWFSSELEYEVVEMPGRIVRELLEKCVAGMAPDGSAECPTTPHCSAGLSFTADLTKPAKDRVGRCEIHGKPILDDKVYYVGIDAAYTGRGKAVRSIKALPRLIDHEDGVEAMATIVNWFGELRDDDADHLVAVLDGQLREIQPRVSSMVLLRQQADNP